VSQQVSKSASQLKLMDEAVAGECRFCGCTELCACVFPDGSACGWVFNSRTLCSHPVCCYLAGMETQMRRDGHSAEFQRAALDADQKALRAQVAA
jgi:hypothetical protein